MFNLDRGGFLQCSGLDQSSVIIRKIARQVCVSLPSRKNVGVERKQRTTGEYVGLNCACVCTVAHRSSTDYGSFHFKACQECFSSRF